MTRVSFSIVSVLAAFLAGCAASERAPPVAKAAPTPAAVSWDGTYRGAVQITGLGSGTDRRWCETDPEIVIEVKQNRFSYAMPHPNVPGDFTPVYAATIASDGTFISQIGTGSIHGQVNGSHMSGTIDGSACVYSFSLNRS